MSGFRVYAPMDQRMPLSAVATHARRAERLGYDGLAVPESVHDGLLAASLALAATTRLRVATSVLVAFPRSPMTVAMAAWDLQEMSGGRFELGIGSQVKGNVIRRYGSTWSPPAPRMREYVAALRAIFRSWQDGTPLDVRGEHYRIDRMQPFFRPEPLEHPDIPILLGGIGPAMVALAGECADGLVTHPTNTAPRYLREVVLPRMQRGAARTGRDALPPVWVSPLVATGPDEAAVALERERVVQLLAFLFSTPSYAPSLELFGWSEIGTQLHAHSREGRWADMPALISDPMLEAFAPSAPYEGIDALLRDLYGGLTDWITFPLPADPSHDERAAEVIARLAAPG